MSDKELMLELADTDKFLYEGFKDFEQYSNAEHNISISWMRIERNKPMVTDLYGNKILLGDYYSPVTNQSVFQWLLDKGII